jgi:large subunit ribosomal protein L22
MEFVSSAKYARVSPRKAREVVRMIKTLQPDSALEVLPHVNKRFAQMLFKVVATAVSNAVNKGADRSSLRFKEIQVNEGPKLKRYRPGSRGAAKPYVKRMSHIRIVLETKTNPSLKSKVQSEKSEMKKEKEVKQSVKKEK